MDGRYFQLCLVTNHHIGDDKESLGRYLDFLTRAIQGWCDRGGSAKYFWVEWREKIAPQEKLFQAEAMAELCKNMGAVFIINDYPHLVGAVSADGAHIGNSDGSPIKARAIMGEEKILGLSIENEQDLQKAHHNWAVDYVTASAVFPSDNKDDLVKIWGLDGLRKLSGQKIHQPLTAIGGITLQNLPAVMTTGVKGVAMVGELHQEFTGGPAVEIITASCYDIINGDRNKDGDGYG